MELAKSESDLVYHTSTMKAALSDLAGRLREDVEKMGEPKAQALYETTAEVLLGLWKAFDDYEKKSELAWQR